MKTYAVYFTAICILFSFNCFGQRNGNVAVSVDKGKTNPPYDNTSKDDLVITGYYVEEIINMPFGKRITKYEVSKLSMVNTYDLGPSNTRTVTPIYSKTKVKIAEIGSLDSKKVIETTTDKTINAVNVDVIPPSEGPKYVIVDIINTYEKVLGKGYESIDMSMKVADRSYFKGDLVLAAKYYAQLFSITTDLDAIYYFRYAQSLKAINQTKKADEMMKLFESKNLVYNIAKE